VTSGGAAAHGDAHGGQEGAIWQRQPGAPSGGMGARRARLLLGQHTEEVPELRQGPVCAPPTPLLSPPFPAPVVAAEAAVAKMREDGGEGRGRPEERRAALDTQSSIRMLALPCLPAHADAPRALHIRSVLSCPAESCAVLFSPGLFCPVLFCPLLLCPVQEA